jgi:NADH-quinone oxidoreductase subunit C
MSTASAPASGGNSEADGSEPTPEAVPEPERRHGALVTRSRGQEVLHPTRDAYIDLVTALCEDGFVMCADLCAVDYLERPVRDLPAEIRPERFEVVVNLLALEPHERVRLRVQVPEDDAWVPTLFAIYPGSEAMEREAFDMFGIIFSGHPDLTRILMPEDWEGHPLRKDYAIGRIPVQFKAAPSTR